MPKNLNREKAFITGNEAVAWAALAAGAELCLIPHYPQNEVMH